MNKERPRPRHLHPLFRRWTHIRQSILNPRCPDYKEGLNCDGLDDFDFFAAWIERDLGPPPTPNHKLNRIDQSQGWIQGNLRWTTSKGVAHNLAGHNIWVELRGERLCLQDLAERYGIKYGTVASRYHRGWTPEQIISVTPKMGNRVIKPRRETQNDNNPTNT